jgi:DNA polymerase-3 subunit epsilon
VFDTGRQVGESAVVLIEQGQYQGYGYLDVEDSAASPEVLRDAIRPLPGNPETNRIVQRFLQKNRHLKTRPLL